MKITKLGAFSALLLLVGILPPSASLFGVSTLSKPQIVEQSVVKPLNKKKKIRRFKKTLKKALKPFKMARGWAIFLTVLFAMLLIISSTFSIAWMYFIITFTTPGANIAVLISLMVLINLNAYIILGLTMFGRRAQKNRF